MKEKIDLLMQETGCERGEAELALEICGFDVEQAAKAIPRLFHNIAVIQGKAWVKAETLYLLFLAILNLKDHSLVRTRAVASYNPAIFSAKLDQNWFQFERHLYANRLRVGSLQPLSQEIEHFLSDFFASKEAASFYSETARSGNAKGEKILSAILSQRFHPHAVKVEVHRDVLDMGAFQEVVDSAGNSKPRSLLPHPFPGEEREVLGGATKPLVLRIAMEGKHDGILAENLRPGDLVYAQIIDQRDIAQYLGRVLGAKQGDAIMVPVESTDIRPGREVLIRVRFSRGVCGEVVLPKDIRVQVVSRAESEPWWRKIIG